MRSSSCYVHDQPTIKWVCLLLIRWPNNYVPIRYFHTHGPWYDRWVCQPERQVVPSIRPRVRANDKMVNWRHGRSQSLRSISPVGVRMVYESGNGVLAVSTDSAFTKLIPQSPVGETGTVVGLNSDPPLSGGDLITRGARAAKFTASKASIIMCDNAITRSDGWLEAIGKRGETFTRGTRGREITGV